MNNEILEEAAEKESEVQGWGKYESTPEQHAIKHSFINGFKLSKQNCYSEEEVLDLLNNCRSENPIDVEKWFENNKKK
jgi:hypothetical protein